MNDNELIEDRESKYGPYSDSAKVAWKFMQAMREGWIRDTDLTLEVVGVDIDPVVEMTLISIFNKISRLVTGDSYDEDTWADIAGYAEQGRRYVKETFTPPNSELVEGSVLVESVSTVEENLGTIAKSIHSTMDNIHSAMYTKSNPVEEHNKKVATIEEEFGGQFYGCNDCGQTLIISEVLNCPTSPCDMRQDLYRRYKNLKQEEEVISKEDFEGIVKRFGGDYFACRDCGQTVVVSEALSCPRKPCDIRVDLVSRNKFYKRKEKEEAGFSDVVPTEWRDENGDIS